ncbi:AGAP011278-PA-like protein [Anopheles sinensis]|uniref:Galectin n=1 Tax=Anopheles sinensis TaxID=74873 RepID=A0A084VZV9_ANOSI|nr:AGAP011278-PA-like protein [Anopheles sinensis]
MSRFRNSFPNRRAALWKDRQSKLHADGHYLSKRCTGRIVVDESGAKVSRDIMSSVQVFTPLLPYVGRLPGELRYGSRIKLKGHFREPQNTLHIILQKEALLNPHEDVPLYITIHPGRKEIVRNHLCIGCTADGAEERVPNCPIECGQDFELTIVPTTSGYEIVLHGTPFHTFGYRVPLASARYLFISSGCIIFAIHYENWNATTSEQPHRAQQPTAPPFHLPAGLYPTLEQASQQHQYPRAAQQQHLVGYHQHQQHQPANVGEVILQVLPLVQLAASQLQANSNARSTIGGNAGLLLGIESLAHLLPLFQADRKQAAKARRINRCLFWRSCFNRMSRCEAMPAAILCVPPQVTVE